MAPRLSISLLVLLSLVLFSSLLPSAFAGRPGSHPPDPLGEPRPDPAPAPVAGVPVAAGAPAPFSETDEGEEDGIDLADLAEKIKDLIDDISSLFGAAATSTTSPPPAYASATSYAAAALSTANNPANTAGLNATLACEIYQAYTSICPATTMLPTTVIDGPLTEIITASSELAYIDASIRASCLCYSSDYWVPEVYDNAAWVCAGYTTGDTSFMVAATSASSAAAAVITRMYGTGWTTESGFCESIGAVRTDAPSATFGQYAMAATTIPAATSTSAAASSATASGAVGRAFRVEKGPCACLAAMALAAAVL